MTTLEPTRPETLTRGPLASQTLLVLGGSSGIGLATAVAARAAGADVALVGRDAERLARAAATVGARQTAALDVGDVARLEAFVRSLPPVDHVLLTAGGPLYGSLRDLDVDAAERHLGEAVGLVLRVAQLAVGAVRPGGSLLLIGGTGSRRPAVGVGLTAALSAAVSALVPNLALELAPMRVNLLAPGFVDTPLSASLLGDGLDDRRAQLRATLPIRRVVQPEDVAALAVHVMTNTALTGAILDVDGGQQLV
jgi:NAD(P)-dependent dehydrogenase (short-subunit alcohol dehydrogenase family)